MRPVQGRTGLILLALCMEAVTLAAGCRTIEGTRGIPPFWETYESPGTFGAFRGGETYLRPFVSWERYDDAVHRVQSVPPILDFEWGPRGDRYWALPIFHYRSVVVPYSTPDVDWALFPLIFAGNDPGRGSYFAVFPFGGTLRGLLAKDEVRFILFPIYFRSRIEARESLHVLWPFFNTVWGGEWSGTRLWPFYGRYEWRTKSGRPRYDRRFVLWPFYVRGHEQLDWNPTEFLFIFPFYGERTNRRIESHTYLWPLYIHEYDRKYDREIHRGYIFPFQITDGQTDIWPFFGVKKVSRGREVGGVLYRRYRHFVLWPIERYDWSSDGVGESTRFWLLPLYWHFHYIDNDTLVTRAETKLWPLCRYRREGNEVAFDLVSPLFFSLEKYDRYYERLFNIFRYRAGGRIGGWEILYGAVMYRTEERDSVFQVLGGLLELGTREGNLALRLLYVPWW